MEWSLYYKRFQSCVVSLIIYCLGTVPVRDWHCLWRISL